MSDTLKFVKGEEAEAAFSSAPTSPTLDVRVFQEKDGTFVIRELHLYALEIKVGAKTLEDLSSIFEEVKVKVQTIIEHTNELKP